jgi:hypothetical protein
MTIGHFDSSSTLRVQTARQTLDGTGFHHTLAPARRCHPSKPSRPPSSPGDCLVRRWLRLLTSDDSRDNGLSSVALGDWAMLIAPRIGMSASLDSTVSYLLHSHDFFKSGNRDVVKTVNKSAALAMGEMLRDLGRGFVTYCDSTVLAVTLLYAGEVWTLIPCLFVLEESWLTIRITTASSRR